MTMTLPQGVDPETVFADLYPVLYAASAPLDGGYARMSEICAALADAYAGIRGTTVLDIGCGYGTTAMAIAAYDPKAIVAVDNAPGMIELLKAVCFGEDDLDAWLRGRGAEAVLDDLYPPVLAHLRHMRAAFRGSIFWHHRRLLLPIEGDGLGLEERSFLNGSFGVVIGNNYLHWPVNQRIAQLRREQEGWWEWDDVTRLHQASADALGQLSRLLPSRGIAVLMEPSDFITVDDRPDWNDTIVAHSMVSHPLFAKFHGTVNAILKQEHGIDRKVPTVTGLFRTSEFPKLAAAGGFALRRIHHVDYAYPCDPLDVFFVRLPLLLGGLKIPFEAKVALGRRVRDELRQTATAAERAAPVRAQWFFLVLEKQ